MFEWLCGSAAPQSGYRFKVLLHFDCGAAEQLQPTLFKSGPVFCSLDVRPSLYSGRTNHKCGSKDVFLIISFAYHYLLIVW